AFAELDGNLVQLDNHPNIQAGLFPVNGHMAIRVVTTPNYKMALEKFDPSVHDKEKDYSAGERVKFDDGEQESIYEATIDIEDDSREPDEGDWTLLHDSPNKYNETTYDITKAVDYGSLIVTVAMETDQVLRYVATSPSPSAFESKNTLTLKVEGAGLNYVVPGTVWSTYEDTARFHNGKILRNDYAKLRAIAKTALAWYGTQRASINVIWNTSDKKFRLGSMIEDISSSWQRVSIKTIVTRQTWDFVNQSFYPFDRFC
ncbi:unnamed protein product, partial [marine sediment metagenome]